MTLEEFRACALALPGVEEGTTHGDPSFKLRSRFLTRLRDDGRIVLPIDVDEREMLMQAEPETFTLTDHYRGSGYVLAQLDSAHPAIVARLLEQAWRRKALKRTVAAYDIGRGEGPAE